MIRSINRIIPFNYHNKSALICLNKDNQMNIALNVCRLKNIYSIQKKIEFRFSESKKITPVIGRIKKQRIKFEKTTSKSMMIKHNEAMNLLKQKKYMSAIKIEQQILELHNRSYGENCQLEQQIENRILFMKSLIEMYQQGQKVNKACQLLEKQLNFKINNKSSKIQDFQQLLISYCKFANILILLNKYQKAISILQKGLKLANSRLDHSNKNIFNVKMKFFYMIGQYQFVIGKQKKSLETFQQLIKHFSDQLKNNHNENPLLNAKNSDILHGSFDKIFKQIIPKLEVKQSQNYIDQLLDSLQESVAICYINDDYRFIIYMSQICRKYRKTFKTLNQKGKKLCFKTIDRFHSQKSVSTTSVRIEFILIQFYMVLCESYLNDNKMLCSKYLMSQVQLMTQNHKHRIQSVNQIKMKQEFHLFSQYQLNSHLGIFQKTRRNYGKCLRHMIKCKQLQEKYEHPDFRKSKHLNFKNYLSTYVSVMLNSKNQNKNYYEILFYLDKQTEYINQVYKNQLTQLKIINLFRKGIVNYQLKKYNQSLKHFDQCFNLLKKTINLSLLKTHIMTTICLYYRALIAYQMGHPNQSLAQLQSCKANYMLFKNKWSSLDQFLQHFKQSLSNLFSIYQVQTDFQNIDVIMSKLNTLQIKLIQQMNKQTTHSQHNYQLICEKYEKQIQRLQTTTQRLLLRQTLLKDYKLFSQEDINLLINKNKLNYINQPIKQYNLPNLNEQIKVQSESKNLIQIMHKLQKSTQETQGIMPGIQVEMNQNNQAQIVSITPKFKQLKQLQNKETQQQDIQKQKILKQKKQTKIKSINKLKTQIQKQQQENFGLIMSEFSKCMEKTKGKGMFPVVNLKFNQDNTATLINVTPMSKQGKQRFQKWAEQQQLQKQKIEKQKIRIQTLKKEKELYKQKQRQGKLTKLEKQLQQAHELYLPDEIAILINGEIEEVENQLSFTKAEYQKFRKGK